MLTRCPQAADGASEKPEKGALVASRALHWAVSEKATDQGLEEERTGNVTRLRKFPPHLLCVPACEVGTEIKRKETESSA